VLSVPLEKENSVISKISQLPLVVSIRANQDPIVQSDTSSCVIPFIRIGKLIIIKARANDTEGNFILDTGAPHLVLNITYFRNLETTLSTDGLEAGINGSAGASEKTMVKNFRLGTIRYSKVETGLTNLGPIEKIRGIKILGLVGVSLFKECEVVIDYQKNELQLHHISRKERKTYKHALLDGSMPYEEHSFTLRENRIILPAKVGGKKLQLVVDYAAESNILDSRLPGTVLDSVTISGRVLVAGTGSKKVEALTGLLSGFYINGGMESEMPVVVLSLEKSCFSDDNCINGVLGYDFLSRYRLIFNFVTSKLYVLP
jgi:hypothetical protein